MLFGALLRILAQEFNNTAKKKASLAPHVCSYWRLASHHFEVSFVGLLFWVRVGSEVPGPSTFLVLFGRGRTDYFLSTFGGSTV